MNDKGIHLSRDEIKAILNEKETEKLKQVTRVVLSDEQLLQEILQGIKSKPESYRYNCYKVALQICKEYPKRLYPFWDYFVEFLKSPNAYHRMAAITLIAHLTSVDKKHKFEIIFENYFHFLDDQSMIVARYLAISAGIIAVNKSVLRERIIEKLLKIDTTHHQEGRKDLIKHDIIQTIRMIFTKLTEKEKIISFIENQVHCSSPKTRQAAKAFLDQWKIIE